MSLGIRTEGLTLRYGDTVALDGLTIDLAPGVVHGLFGRNGSGKTSLLSVLAAFRRATSGRVEVGGRDPFEDQQLMSQTCLVREGGDVEPSLTVEGALCFPRDLRPRWDQAYAEYLADRFELSLRTRVRALSRGRRSALGIVLGLASRAPLTLFDEAHLGLDAPSRYTFHDETTPRTHARWWWRRTSSTRWPGWSSTPWSSIAGGWSWPRTPRRCGPAGPR